MLIDFPVSDLTALVVGGGVIAERKARKLLQERADVVVASKEFTAGLRSLGARQKLKLLRTDADADPNPLEEAIAESDIVIVATNDPRVNGEVARRARRKGILVNAADNPSASDFNFPAAARAGSIRIAVSTGGRSPAMARLICAKLLKAVSREDRIRVELLGKLRDSAKESLTSPAARRAAFYAILDDRKVAGLIRAGRLADAERAAEAIMAGE